MSAQLSITVNLPAIVYNWQLLQARIDANGAGECGAVVKANAYGLGMLEVANALYVAGCKSYFVANHEEALALRLQLGNCIRIYVLQGVEQGCEALFIEHQLIPVLISRAMVERWHDYLESNALCAPSVVKVNTGMNRLGLNPDEFEDALLEYPSVFNHAESMLLSHLACADEPGHPLNEAQRACFSRLLTVAQAKYPHLRASLANSSGIFLGSAFQFALARPGAALYGLNPTPQQANPMHSVLTLSLPILQLRAAPAGSWVGYGADKQLQRDSVLAIVAGGYADGILRAAFDQMRGWVSGCTVPMAGRVSMDTLIFDVTDAEGISEHDEIEILGPNLSADHQALVSGTIGYEVLTRIGERVTRKYLPLPRGC